MCRGLHSACGAKGVSLPSFFGADMFVSYLFIPSNMSWRGVTIRPVTRLVSDRGISHPGTRAKKTPTRLKARPADDVHFSRTRCGRGPMPLVTDRGSEFELMLVSLISFLESSVSRSQPQHATPILMSSTNCFLHLCPTSFFSRYESLINGRLFRNWARRRIKVSLHTHSCNPRKSFVDWGETNAWRGRRTLPTKLGSPEVKVKVS